LGTPSAVCSPRSYSATATPSLGWDRRRADQGSAPAADSALRVGNLGNIDAAVSLTKAQFRYGFGNGISEDESDELFDKWAMSSPGRPLFQAAGANVNPRAQTKVDTKNQGPRTAAAHQGGKDHTVPETKRQVDCSTWHHA
jgi:hypothetical protein